MAQKFSYPREINKLCDSLFHKTWERLAERFTEPEWRYPGVYVLAYTHAALNGKKVRVKDIFYVGMSNSAGGVRERLRQFKRGVENGKEHSGAIRFLKKFAKRTPYSRLKSKKTFYLAARTIPCTSKKSQCGPHDLRLMGHITCLEYYVRARVWNITGKDAPPNKLFESDQPRSEPGNA